MRATSRNVQLFFLITLLMPALCTGCAASRVFEIARTIDLFLIPVAYVIGLFVGLRG